MREVLENLSGRVDDKLMSSHRHLKMVSGLAVPARLAIQLGYLFESIFNSVDFPQSYHQELASQTRMFFPTITIFSLLALGVVDARAAPYPSKDIARREKIKTPFGGKDRDIEPLPEAYQPDDGHGVIYAISQGYEDPNANNSLVPAVVIIFSRPDKDKNGGETDARQKQDRLVRQTGKNAEQVRWGSNVLYLGLTPYRPDNFSFTRTPTSNTCFSSCVTLRKISPRAGVRSSRCFTNYISMTRI